MEPLRDALEQTGPLICHVQESYLNYMQQEDGRISFKEGQPFVGLVVYIHDRLYVVPMTSQTRNKRSLEGKKRRSSSITVFLYDDGEEIANLLYNNMFPCPDDQIVKIEISCADAFLQSEVRAIRKDWAKINEKAMDVYQKRHCPERPDYSFYDRLCCDYEKLENACDKWEGKNYDNQ